jgi:transposase-like protein
MEQRPMWTCPRCGRSFANRNQSHACAPLDLARHLDGRDPEVVAIYRRLVELAERNGPVTVLAEKTRIALQVRLATLEEADEEVAAWLAEAYRVGAQRHLMS